MKKLSLIAIGAMLALLAGCGGSTATPTDTKNPAPTADKPATDNPPKSDAPPVQASGDVVGKWTLVMTDEMKKQMDDAIKAAAGQGQKLEPMTMTCEFKGDGTCSMSANGMGQSQSAKGTYKVEGDTIVITPTEVMMNGKPDTSENAKKPVKMKWSKDKTMLEAIEEDGKSAGISFKRA